MVSLTCGTSILKGARVRWLALEKLYLCWSLGEGANEVSGWRHSSEDDMMKMVVVIVIVTKWTYRHTWASFKLVTIAAVKRLQKPSRLISLPFALQESLSLLRAAMNKICCWYPTLLRRPYDTFPSNHRMTSLLKFIGLRTDCCQDFLTLSSTCRVTEICQML